MLVNYIRTARRHLIRRKGFALLNIFGLSIGVADLLLIGLYLRHELTYESVHREADLIFRVVVDRRYEEGRTRSPAPTSPPLARLIRANVPEVEDRFVVIALVVGMPITYAAMERWLDQFAYRTAIQFRVFLITGMLMLVVAMVTVGWQSVRAALADPVDSLRND